MQNKIPFIEKKIINELLDSDIDKYERLQLISDICRVNAFSAVKNAGSGHLGTSFSAIDIFTYLFYEQLSISEDLDFNNPNRDIFFSSKGHDSPALYSILYSLDIVSLDKLINFRRLGGLDGHPDIKIDGVEANTGSLGMGISKAKGMAWAKEANGLDGYVYVMTGDGELQEGQIFESMQTLKHQNLNKVVVIVDHNKCQTENTVEDTISLGDLDKKFTSFGWHVERCDGHDFKSLEKVFNNFMNVSDKPKILIADTIKGKGVSFMEHPAVLKETNGTYRFHAGAPSNIEYLAGVNEIIDRIEKNLKPYNSIKPSFYNIDIPEKGKSGMSDEFLAVSFKNELLRQAEKNKDIVLLDGDLLGDARLQDFREKFPAQFIENGIAEQDMVSAAGGLALQGKLPVVNSFASFLSARANEQIYNNATELTKIIYINLYAGLIPAGPGKSHQSLRDIALVGSIPNIIIVQPSNEVEAHSLLDWCINETKNNCAIRLNIGPSPKKIVYPDNWKLKTGVGTVINNGCDGVLFSYGPVMLNESLKAASILDKKNYSLKVISMPWLNRFDNKWILDELKDIENIFVLEDHNTFGGLGDSLFPEIYKTKISNKKLRFKKFGIDQMPACGTPKEVLEFHEIDGLSLANKIIKASSINE